MPEIRAVVADDEPLARDNIEALLDDEPDVRVVARCGSGAETVRVVNEAQPDLLFLDVRMPEGGGLDVVERIEPRAMPLVVFVTAYDDFAVAAFEAQALDYLTKPLDERRFRETMRRVRRRLEDEQDVQLARRVRGLLDDATPLLARTGDPASRDGWEDRIRIQRRERTYFVPLDEVLWIEADDGGVVLHTASGAHTHRATLSEMEKHLEPARWVRIHRSHMVKLEAIREIQPYFHGDYIVILENRTRLRMSRRRRAAVRRLLGG